MSTGQRINSASDDAAGLAISEHMRARINGLLQARRNAQDALSLLHTAEGSIGQIQEMITRIRTLVIQAANDTYNSDDRKKIQAEIDELVDEITQTAYRTEFNSLKILVQDEDPRPKLRMTTVDQTGGDYDWDNDGEDDWTKEEMDELSERIPEIVYDAQEKAYARIGWGNKTDTSYTINLYTTMPPDEPLASAGENVMNLNLSYILGGRSGMHITVEQLITHEITHSMMRREGISDESIHSGQTYPNGDVGWTVEGAAEWVADAGDKRMYPSTTASSILDRLRRDGLDIDWDSDDYSEAFLVFKFLNEKFGASTVTAVSNSLEGGSSMEEAILANTPYTASGLGDAGPPSGTFEAEFQDWATEYINADEYKDINPTRGLAYTPNNPDPLWSDLFDIHIGAEVNETLQIRTPDVRAGALDYLGFVDVSTHDLCERSLVNIDKALDMLNNARSDIGAKESRLLGVIRELGTMLENESAAVSRIKDLDFGYEVTSFTRDQILSQTGLAMLAQANQLPQMVLELI